MVGRSKKELPTTEWAMKPCGKKKRPLPAPVVLPHIIFSPPPSPISCSTSPTSKVQKEAALVPFRKGGRGESPETYRAPSHSAHKLSWLLKGRIKSRSGCAFPSLPSTKNLDVATRKGGIEQGRLCPIPKSCVLRNL